MGSLPDTLDRKQQLVSLFHCRCPEHGRFSVLEAFPGRDLATWSVEDLLETLRQDRFPCPVCHVLYRRCGLKVENA
jgi:hypothetical protein